MPETLVEKKASLQHTVFIKDYLNPCLPVVIPDATKGWKAHEKWTPDFFIKAFGDRIVKVKDTDYKMKDLLELIMASTAEKPAPYLNEVNIPSKFPELMTDIKPYLHYAMPDRLRSRFIPKSWGFRDGIIELLIGGKGTQFPVLHYDGFHMHTFITQVRGDKEFFFYSPDQSPFMYPEEHIINRSRINNAFNPDYEKFPLFRNAKASSIIVKEGETIFIPSGWWHTTRILSLSIAVSINIINNKMWNSYVNDYFAIHNNLSPVKRKALRLYLNTAGVLMSLKGE